MSPPSPEALYISCELLKKLVELTNRDLQDREPFSNSLIIIERPQRFDCPELAFPFTRLQAYPVQALLPTPAVDNQLLRSLEGKDDPRISNTKKDGDARLSMLPLKFCGFSQGIRFIFSLANQHWYSY